MKPIDQYYKDRLTDLTDHVCLNEVINVFSMNGLDAQAYHVRELEKSIRSYVATVCADVAKAG